MSEAQEKTEAARQQARRSRHQNRHDLRDRHDRRCADPRRGSHPSGAQLGLLHPARGVRHHQPLHCRGRDGAELQRRIIKRIEVEKI